MCNETESIYLFEEPVPNTSSSVSIVKCQSCGLIATSPPPSEEVLEILYGQNSYLENTVSGTYCTDEKYSDRFFSSVLYKLQNITDGRRILDVGCGVGIFVENCRKKKWDVYGIEPSKYAGEIAKQKYGERITIGFLAEKTSYKPFSFDVITLYGVLEHVLDPSSLLKKVNYFLKDNGVVVVHVPNWYYIKIRRGIKKIFSGNYGTVHPIEHPYQYTPSTMKKLLLKSGFKVIEESVRDPYYLSHPIINSMKWLSYNVVKTFFLITGINLAGIVLYAIKQENII